MKKIIYGDSFPAKRGPDVIKGPVKITRRCLFLFVFLLQSFCQPLFAQFNYAASKTLNTSGTYTDLGTTGTVITTANNDDANSSSQNIGFTFYFNGASFTQFILNTNGFIKLGTIAPATNNFDVLNSAETNTLAPFNYDLRGGTSTTEYRVATSGAAGSQVCTIQFENVRDAATSQYNNINFQVKLYETTNVIEFVYGTFTTSGAAAAFKEMIIGIKGSDDTHSVNATKGSADSWSTTTFIDGVYASTKFNNRNNVLPAPGRVFRFNTQCSPAPGTELTGTGQIVYNSLNYFRTCTGSPSALFNFTNASTTSGTNTSYMINWGDASSNFITASLTNVSHTYATGIYTLSFMVTGPAPDFCTAIGTYYVFVGTNPSVGLSISGSGTTFCSDAHVNFPISGTSANPLGTTYTFTVNDGSPPVLLNHPPPASVDHTFTTSSCGNNSSDGVNTYPNSFSASITASNACGNSSSGVVPIYVSEAPVSAFNISPNDTICASGTVNLINTGRGHTVENGTCVDRKSLWFISPFTGVSVVGGSLGNDLGSTNPNVWLGGTDMISLNFTTPGTYNITLVTGASLLCDNDTLTKTFTYATVTTANAGPAQNITGTSVTMAANTPVNGTGTWSYISGPIVPAILNPTSPSTVIAGLYPGVYVFQWTIANGPCTSSSNVTVTTTIGSNPYISTYWTWMNGDSTANVDGVYGTKGVSSALNKPGSRHGSVSWTDTSGNFWLFGGNSYSTGLFNDLWKYNVSSNQWTWVNGDNTEDNPGSYGSLGIAAAGNRPSARTGSVSWRDNENNLWLFGGSASNGSLNDLWKYDISTNQWTWIKGDSTYNNPGSYGIAGVASASNKPGSRLSEVGWTDNDGNLWLFGGFGYGNSNSDELNDLWKYDISTNQWTWMKGDSSVTNYGVYGTRGVQAAGNKPGSRIEGVTWTDNTGDLWLFGGYGYSNYYDYRGSLNDLWRYNISANQWTWINGDSSSFPAGIYGVKGIEDAANKPGGRHGSIGWKDALGNFWMFGGLEEGYSTDLNDLWKYNFSNNKWTWIKGSNTASGGQEVYGVLGERNSLNTPGGRNGDVSWIDKAGNLWMFGGFSYSTGDHYNDLWTIYGGTSYIFNGNGDWDTASNWINNLVAPKNIPGGTLVTIDNIPAGQCNVTGNINTQAAGVLSILPNKKLNIVDGNLTNAGLVTGTGVLSFSGTTSDSAQLSSSGLITTPLVLSNYLVYLAGHTNVTSLELSNGATIKLRGFDLNMDTGTLVTDSVSFIITDGTGRLTRFVSNTAVLFPIGINKNSYTPVTVTNTGTPDNFKARVGPGVFKDSVITQGYVNRTWFVNDSIEGSSVVKLKVQWDTTAEQPGFNRDQSYISRVSVCPLPRNCSGAYFDFDAVNSATSVGAARYSIERDNIDSFKTNAFVVTSKPFVFTFNGNGDWSDTLNWTPGIIPPLIIRAGMEVIINPTGPEGPNSGECNVNGDIDIRQGGKLTIMPGKTIRVIH